MEALIEKRGGNADDVLRTMLQTLYIRQTSKKRQQVLRNRREKAAGGKGGRSTAPKKRHKTKKGVSIRKRGIANREWKRIHEEAKAIKRHTFTGAGQDQFHLIRGGEKDLK